MSDTNPRASIKLPSDFRFGQLRPDHTKPVPPTPPPPLGPLSAFVGDWVGNGFNTIFRPDNSATPTPLPVPFPNSDNILELNLTSESLSFSPSLGSVPNRGTTPQGDIFLNGVPYLLQIGYSVEEDVSLRGRPAVRNRAQARRKREALRGKVQFQNVVAVGKRDRERRWRRAVIG